MGDISIPHQLSSADAVMTMVSQMEKLLGSDQRKKIAEDIVAFHTLNDTEAKKASEARALIAEHKKILDDTTSNLDTIHREKEMLAEEKRKFAVEIEEANRAITLSRNAIQEELNKAKKLQDEAYAERSTCITRNAELVKLKAVNDENSKLLAEKEAKLAEEYRILELRKQEHVNALEELKAKKEAISKFNI